MNDDLAERILAEVMKWEPKDDAIERPILQSLAKFKYDDYQPFSPGYRFLESLALWLTQFETQKEKEVAYNFVRNRMLFISPREMNHLVTMTYPDVVRPFLIEKASSKIGLPEWFVNKTVKSKEYKIILRQSLFLGLSDGAHIDLFRRSNPELSHEQILRTHEISSQRAKETQEKLSEDLKTILGRPPTTQENKFRIVFLLDDFSGSGLSYIRKKVSGFSGKISKFYKNGCKQEGENHSLFNLSELSVCLILYIANSNVISYLEKYGKELFGKIPFKVKVVYPLPESIKVSPSTDSDFIELLKKYYDPAIETTHYKVGRHQKPYLGFDECALPLILSHNTPNNSVTLLWLSEEYNYRGLFPRISRHRDEL